MAYLTKTPLGYYVNRQFVLPTPVGDAIVGAAAQGRPGLGYYARRNFILPTSSHVRNNQALAAFAQASKKSCGCSGVCSHVGKKYRMGLRGLGSLGDDGDDDDFFTTGDTDFWSGSQAAGTDVIDASGDTITSGGIFDSPIGPQPTSQTLALNASQGLAPGTSGTTAWGQLLAALGIAGAGVATKALTPGLTAQQQAALQSPLTAPIAGIGLSPLTIGIIGVGIVVVISVVKSGRR
jgi:hypothetical protein